MAEEQTQPQLRHLVRIAQTDLNGKKTLLYALSKIKGIGKTYANAVCNLAQIEPTKKTGMLNDTEVAKLEKVIKEPIDNGMAPWLLNRRKDFETGEDKHVITGELIFNTENDIKFMKRIKCYKGIRHILGQPVRGQRTRSKFRKNKGKVIGVKRSAGAKKGGGKV
ncbi:30S ribosomal protein S13 [Candidatus Woesearchaeota archaeon]|nr:30S ribosomal protein S13 [Candidatus Woesearchaeota archaeon]